MVTIYQYSYSPDKKLVMKKLITLFFVLLAAITLKTSAQTLICNADFSYSIGANGVVNFTPVQPGDSINTFHQWNFGDGSAIATFPFVSHTYGSAGSYTVKHIIKRNNPNGVAVCNDTVSKVVVIQYICNLQADFSWTYVPGTILTQQFTQSTLPIDATDSVRWNFGDGTIINGLQGNLSIQNPIHTYTNSGYYNVCLRVKKNNNTSAAPCVSEVCKWDSVFSPTTCNLQANYTWMPDSLSSLIIHFTNTTIGLSSTDSIRWTFGDGTSSNTVNPAHTYAQGGTYTVCLRVQKRTATGGLTNCISEKCYVVSVMQPCNLQVYFTQNADSTNIRKIYFHNQSQPSSTTDSLFWTFGDGSSLSGLNSNAAIANPSHEYAMGGSYTVCLKVKQNNTSGTPSGCIRSYCKTIVVQQPCELVVNYTWNADSINSRKIYFHNASAPIGQADSLFWSFGDGSTLKGIQGNSLVANPVHEYANAGSYTVCLKIKKASTIVGATPCIRELCKVIVVQASCNFTPSFTWKIDSLNRKKIIFTNTTLVTTASAIATWNFGDGTSATGWNAVHEYAQPGQYRVCLQIALNNNCIRTKCDTITVPNPMPACIDLSKFTYIRSSTNSQTYTFKPDYISQDIQYTWTFGDGTGSQSAIATHYFAPGTYTVCLTAWKNANCASTTCKTITVTPQINCNLVQVSYTYQKDPLVSNKVYFYAVANYPILDQTWTFTKVSPTTGLPVVLHQNNPIYVFSDTGVYKVCLKAITLGGCIKEYCNYIHIDRVAPQCVLQAYPNPATTQVSVTVQLGMPKMIDAYIYNAQNVLVKEKHQQGVTGSNVVTFQIADLPAGQYTMKVIYGNDVCYSRFNKL